MEKFSKVLSQVQSACREKRVKMELNFWGKNQIITSGSERSKFRLCEPNFLSFVKSARGTFSRWHLLRKNLRLLFFQKGSEKKPAFIGVRFPEGCRNSIPRFQRKIWRKKLEFTSAKNVFSDFSSGFDRKGYERLWTFFSYRVVAIAVNVSNFW